MTSESTAGVGLRDFVRSNIKLFRVPRDGTIVVINETYALEYVSLRGARLAIRAGGKVAIRTERDLANPNSKGMIDPESIGTKLFQVTTSRLGQKVYVGEEGRDCITILGKDDLAIILRIASRGQILVDKYSPQDARILLWHIRNRVRA